MNSKKEFYTIASSFINDSIIKIDEHGMTEKNIEKIRLQKKEIIRDCLSKFLFIFLVQLVIYMIVGMMFTVIRQWNVSFNWIVGLIGVSILIISFLFTLIATTISYEDREAEKYVDMKSGK